MRRLRFVALVFLGVYLPAYALAYGVANFLFLCNLSVILGVIGIWTRSRVLVSSQAIAILLVGAVWTLDLAGRLVLGRHLVGGTEYMWDPQWPLFTRLLSFYHVALPLALVHVARQIGYDARGYWLQSLIAVLAVSAGRLFGPAANINHAFFDPFVKRGWGGPLTHVLVVVGALVLVAYPLSHLLLERLCGSAAGRGSETRGGQRLAYALRARRLDDGTDEPL
jgi:hypothetical protein